MPSFRDTICRTLRSLLDIFVSGYVKNIVYLPFGDIAYVPKTLPKFKDKICSALRIIDRMMLQNAGTNCIRDCTYAV